MVRTVALAVVGMLIIESVGLGADVALENAAVGWWLDIDGRTGAVIVSEKEYAGCRWGMEVLGDGEVRLDNQANTRFRNRYLDIDNRTGRIVLSEKKEVGTRWKRVQLGNGKIGLRVTAAGPFQSYWLDVDKNIGHLMLSDKQEAGAAWFERMPSK